MPFRRQMNRLFDDFFPGPMLPPLSIAVLASILDVVMSLQIDVSETGSADPVMPGRWLLPCMRGDIAASVRRSCRKTDTDACHVSCRRLGALEA